MLQHFLQGLRHYLLALQFFTRVPVTGSIAQWVGFSPAMLRASSAHFPGVGWLVGLWGAGVYGLLMLGLAPSPWASLVAAVLCTAATAQMTGGFHEDGLADVADGLGGSAESERALDIMKDSRLGAYGAMTLVLALLAKISLLALLGGLTPHIGLIPVLLLIVASHVLSRFAPLWLIRFLPHVGDTARSKSKPLADQISGRALLVASLWAAPALLLLSLYVSWWTPLAALLAGSLVTFRMARWFQRRLAGFTGDCLGAVQQISEISVYLAVALLWSALQRAATL